MVKKVVLVICLAILGISGGLVIQYLFYPHWIVQETSHFIAVFPHSPKTYEGVAPQPFVGRLHTWQADMRRGSVLVGEIRLEGSSTLTASTPHALRGALKGMLAVYFGGQSEDVSGGSARAGDFLVKVPQGRWYVRPFVQQDGTVIWFSSLHPGSEVSLRNWEKDFFAASLCCRQPNFDWQSLQWH